MYAAKCDNCSEEVKLGGGEYSAYAEQDGVIDEMIASDYHFAGDKHYCPDCWSLDDEDNIVLKPVNK